MINPKISVIVPVYNTKEYLGKCIDSIINQTYQNLEIILVDDGSTDGSGDIIDGYAKRDGRIVVLHKENGGAGSARNMGLRVAKGAYIGFIDSDDWIEDGMYQALVEAMGDEWLDMVICNYSLDQDDVQNPVKNRKSIHEGIFGKQRLLRYVFQRDDYKSVTAYVVNKIFRKDIINAGESRVEFDDAYLIGEDVLWFSQVGLRCEKIRYIDELYYHYVQRGSSMVHTRNLEKQMQRIDVYNRVIALFEANAVDSETIVYVKRFLAYHAMNIAKLAYEQGSRAQMKALQQVMTLYEKEYVLTNESYPSRIEEYRKVLEMEVVYG